MGLQSVTLQKPCTIQRRQNLTNIYYNIQLLPTNHTSNNVYSGKYLYTNLACINSNELSC